MTLAFDLFAGCRGWEAALADSDDLCTVGFEIDADACATARAAGLHAVQDDVARLVPETIALVYGQPDGLCGSPPCTLFSAAGKGTGRLLMQELHRAVTDAALGASDIAMARHRRELKRLLRIHLRESMGYKRERSSRRPLPKRMRTRESTPVRRGDISREADRMARNVSLVWQPARWVAALRPRWVALEQVPAVLPLWREMACGLETRGYKCWTGILSSERFGVPQTRKRAILLASLDYQPQPPEATHQAYVPGEPARAGEPDLFGLGLLPWVSMATALGWGMTERPGMTLAVGTNSGGADHVGGSGARRTIERGAWLVAADPDDIAVEVNRSEGSGPRCPRKGSEPSPTIRGGAGGGCGPNLSVSLRMTTMPNSAERAVGEPTPTMAFGHDSASCRWVLDRRQTDGKGKPVGPRVASDPAPTMTAQGLALGRDVWRQDIDDPDAYWNRDDLSERKRKAAGTWVTGRPATTVDGDPRISEPGHHDSSVSGSQQANAVRVSVREAAILQSFDPDWPFQGSQTSRFTQIGNAIPPLMARRILLSLLDDRAQPITGDEDVAA